MADQPISQPRKKLYIETVGCQMNVLDSELVVAQLRERGLRADRRHRPGRRDPLQHVLGPAARRGQDLQRAGPDQAHQAGRPEVSIGVLGCMAQKDQEQILKRAPHVDVVVGPGQLGRVPRAAEAGQGSRLAQLAVSLAAERRHSRHRSRPASRIRRRSRAGDAAQPVPGVRPDHDGLRQVLHLLHRPVGPRPRAEPAAGKRSWTRPGSLPTRGSRRSRSWARRSTATSTASPMAGSAGSPTCSTSIHDIAGHRADQVHHQLPQRHDRRPAPGRRDLPKASRYIHVPAQSGCDQVLKRMKRMYTVAFYEDMLARMRETIPGVAVSSDFIVGFCGETEESFAKYGGPGGAGPVQEQLYLQVQSAAGDEGRRAFTRTMFPRR